MPLYRWTHRMPLQWLCSPGSQWEEPLRYLYPGSANVKTCFNPQNQVQNCQLEVFHRPNSKDESRSVFLSMNSSNPLSLYIYIHYAYTHVCAHQEVHTPTAREDYDCLYRSNNLWRTPGRKLLCLEKLLPAIWIRLATRLHFMNEIVVPIFTITSAQSMRPGIGWNTPCVHWLLIYTCCPLIWTCN